MRSPCPGEFRASGKFAAMNEKAGREYAAGRTRQLSDIIEAIKG